MLLKLRYMFTKMKPIDIVQLGRDGLNACVPNSKVPGYCPIDGTQLVSSPGYDFSHYKCVGCGATYSDYRNAYTLRREAKEFLKEKKQELEDARPRVARLEAILALANEKGLAEGI